MARKIKVTSEQLEEIFPKEIQKTIYVTKHEL